MNEDILLVRVERGDDGLVGVLSPGVGWWSNHPHPGALVGPGTRIGTLEHLNRRHVLLLPDGAAGRVTGSLPRDRSVPVEYGQVLILLAPVHAGDDDRPQTFAEALGGAPETGLLPGSRAVVSPTDGVFYRRPSPDARPFVEPGSRIRSGQPIGLVEVMKTFNPVLYGGPGLPDEAEVLEVRCGDTEDVRAGQILIVVRSPLPFHRAG